MTAAISKIDFTTFNQDVICATDEVSYRERLWRTIGLVNETKGTVAAVGTAAGVFFAGAYTALFSYFCFEGTARALHDCHTSVQETGKLSQEIGDAGGWSSLPLFSFYSFRRVLNQLMREGDFAQIKSVCARWCETEAGKEVSAANLYTQLNEIFDQMSGQCLVYKSVISCRLLSMEIVKELKGTKADPCSDYYLDQQLSSVYTQIEEDRKVPYLTRLQASCNVPDAVQGKVSRIITGIVCPIFLSIAAVCSAIGEPILGQKVIGEKVDQTEIGHFGEWPDNIISSSAVACFLHRDLLTTGDISLAGETFQRHLATIQHRMVYNRLSLVAKQEIQQLASQKTFTRGLQLPSFPLIKSTHAEDDCKIDEGRSAIDVASTC